MLGWVKSREESWRKRINNTHFVETKAVGFGGRPVLLPPQKFDIDTQNSYVWKEMPFPNHHCCIYAKFRFVYYRIHVCGSFPGESWRDEPGDKSSGGNTWRIIPFSKWLITMVIVRPLTGVNHFPSKWPWTWLVNRGDPNYLRYLGGIILQVTLRYLMVRNSTFNRQVAEVSYRSPGSPSCLPFRMGRFRALGRNLDSKTDMGGEPPAVSGVRGGGKRWIFFFFWGGSSLFLLVPLSLGGCFF